MSTDSSALGVPLLAAPSSQSLEDPSIPNVSVGAAVPVKLDNLGPIVVNSDGTLSRIANWENMTRAERERAVRVLAVRNRARLAKQPKDDPQDASSASLSVSS